MTVLMNEHWDKGRVGIKPFEGSKQAYNSHT